MIVQLAKNVLIEIVPWVCICGGYGFFISWLDYWELVPSILDTQVNTNAIVDFNLGISIIFILRTHIAHYRFWQGIKLWKRIVNVVQNSVSGILLYVEEQEPQDRKEKKAAMRLVAAFAVAIKLHLRQEPANCELESLVLSPQYQNLQNTSHAPLDITFWIGEYLQYQYDSKKLTFFQLKYLQYCIDEMVNILRCWESILRKQFPSVYTIVLKKIMVLYLLVAPWAMVKNLGWETGLVTAFISFIYLSVSATGVEIERIFSHGSHENSLDFLCDTIKSNVEGIIQQAYYPQPVPISNLPNKIA